ncbi:penicillin-binding protein 2 [bacterium]|nr:penicillin-binding protein 2 [bacterium]NDA09724.1 penicillin-binding protein 2 [Verrucomicrobiota bacterium]NDA25883.1 penicillin-binding protein 2 [Verrucomicrobiota bacterium]NDD81624.1 penicillin-binding protein 2 [Verrucomicrobiota bacterium]
MNPRSRIVVVTVGLALAFTTVSVRLIWIQLVKQQDYREEAIKLHTCGEPVPAQRGSILDVSGRVLAQSVPQLEVRIDGKIFSERPQELPTLANLLGVSAEWLKGQIDPQNRYQKIADGVNADLEGKLRTAQLRSIRFERKTVRDYPNGTETSQVLGFVNLRDQELGSDRTVSFEIGEGGIEKSMDRYLKGVAGERRIIRDAKRREIPYFRLSDRPARDGYHVVLTIDQSIQHIVEREADRLVEQFQPENLHILVVRPATGEILAMASRPVFDPNHRDTFQPDGMKPRAIADAYEPGSTFKVVTLAAGLNEGVADLNTTFFCENGQMMMAGRVLKDHEAYGLLSLREIIAKSSNIGMAKLAALLGEEKLHEYARLFGFGARAQKGEGMLPGEIAGTLHPLKNWTKVSMTRFPMGYEVAVTNLQMALAYAAIANGGKRMEPRLIKAVVDRDNRVVMQFLPKVVCQVIRPETAKSVTEALRGVVSDEGTAGEAQVPGFTVAGKTGTAQKYTAEGYVSKYRSSFIGFLPADKAEFLVSILVDDPKGKKYYGGQVAAPAFREIATHVAEQLNLDRGAVVASREKL